jgi:DNA-directed RNA polymerase subunit F
MANPEFISEEPLTLQEVKEILHNAEKRDEELNFLSNKTKEYMDAFVTISGKDRKELHKKLTDLDLTRLKEEHIAKIIDFLPISLEDLRVVLQAYPLSLPKTQQQSIVDAVKGIV